MKREPSWDDVLAAAARLQRLVPDAVLVGGTAAAAHAKHRVSFGDDHVLDDLRTRFDDVLDHVERAEGWRTARVNRPVLILGSLDGVETGIRQLVRSRPLELEELDTPAGSIRIPTLPEMLRVKAWLILRRNATRDYLDTVALAERLGGDQAARSSPISTPTTRTSWVRAAAGSRRSSQDSSPSRFRTTCPTSTSASTGASRSAGRTGTTSRARARRSPSPCSTGSRRRAPDAAPAPRLPVRHGGRGARAGGDRRPARPRRPRRLGPPAPGDPPRPARARGRSGPPPRP